jgi:hypothetical protein
MYPEAKEIQKNDSSLIDVRTLSQEKKKEVLVEVKYYTENWLNYNRD